MRTDREHSLYYLIKESELNKDIELLRGALRDNWGDNSIMGYSVKTNSLPWLLNHLRKEGFYAEVVSDSEYDLARRLGYDADKIIYNGPIKDRAVFKQVIKDGGIVNLDSNYELDWLEEMSASSMAIKVGIRINADIASLSPNEELLEEDGGRFGYCLENGTVAQVVERIKSMPNVKLSGLHLHSSTKSRSVEVYGALAKLAVNVARDYNLDIEYIDMGGGYFGGRDDMPNYRDYFGVIARVLSECFSKDKVTLIAEPGVSLVSRASSLITEVIDTKDIRGHRYVVTTGSRVLLNPQVTRHTYPHHIEYMDSPTAPDGPRQPLPSQWICGSTCMEYDRLFEIRDGAELKPGDRVVYDLAGGYTIALSPLFIHYFPKVIIEKITGETFVARDEWTNDEFLMKNHWE
ncbi:MAG: pyridoxal-dependent decarboxylase [Lachnospiraceae bacterium]|nr:pyridoxal-dependent decarboxylase [Lachnospiraceae bacterium]